MGTICLGVCSSDILLTDSLVLKRTDKGYRANIQGGFLCVSVGSWDRRTDELKLLLHLKEAYIKIPGE